MDFILPVLSLAHHLQSLGVWRPSHVRVKRNQWALDALEWQAGDILVNGTRAERKQGFRSEGFQLGFEVADFYDDDFVLAGFNAEVPKIGEAVKRGAALCDNHLDALYVYDRHVIHDAGVARAVQEPGLLA